MAETPQWVLGRYHIFEEVGRGGFAVVYRATRPPLETQVALKLLDPALFSDPTIRKHFIEEARRVAALAHPRIVRVLDLEEVEGRAFLTMEYQPGGNLHDWLGRNPRPSLRQISAFISDVAEALDFAHGKGQVHGDVKPANILIGADGRAKLGDFGLLRVIESSNSGTNEMALGTPYYMSPEQAQGQRSPLSDQYALGVMAYELLAGHPPFDGETSMVILLKHIRQEPPALSGQDSRVTPEVEAVVLRAIAKEPAQRFATSGEFARALRSAVAATETRRKQELQTRITEALSTHDGSAAQSALQELNELDPEDPQARKLLIQVSQEERARQNYASASESLASARQRAATLRNTTLNLPDQSGLLAKLAPTPIPAWRKFIQTWRMALIVFAGTVGMGLVLGLLLLDLVNQALIPPVCTVRGQTWTSPVDGMDLMCVPSGKFMMGSSVRGIESWENEFPEHEVTLDAFWIDETEVTNAMYRKCVQAGKCAPPSASQSNTRPNYYDATEFDNYPVIYVNWHDAQTYCAWAGKRMLPTEAQWEKAARGGVEGKLYPWDNTEPICASGYMNSAQFESCASRDTAPVGSFAPNGYGLYDMAGNVWEWTSDWYDYYQNAPQQNPVGPLDGATRAVRGGSWSSIFNTLRAANRVGLNPSNHYFDLGFRCATTR